MGFLLYHDIVEIKLWRHRPLFGKPDPNDIRGWIKYRDGRKEPFCLSDGDQFIDTLTRYIGATP